MQRVGQARERLLAYVKRECWIGWDPFDGLNSEIFQATPLRGNRLARLAFLQACKRSPFNLRPLLRVPKQANNKGLGLFLASVVRLFHLTKEPQYREQAAEFIKQLTQGVSPGYHGACWGYNFDWQARAFFQPKGTPTVVATHFIANALLDACECFPNEECLTLARSACEFILWDLNRTYDGDTICFSYSPEDRTQVFNASLLGAQLLARVGSLTNEADLKSLALKAAAYVIARQRSEGAWAYGTLPYHQWVDNFHTGFILDCLGDIARYTGVENLNLAIEKGFHYFRNNFFLQNGAPKYYDDRVFPIDAHSSAQAILTLLRFGDYEMAKRVAAWSIENMQAPSGYFYYQKTAALTNRTPYMRWVQAWMLRALVELELAESPVSHKTVESTYG